MNQRPTAALLLLGSWLCACPHARGEYMTRQELERQQREDDRRFEDLRGQKKQQDEFDRGRNERQIREQLQELRETRRLLIQEEAADRLRPLDRRRPSPPRRSEAGELREFSDIYVQLVSQRFRGRGESGAAQVVDDRTGERWLLAPVRIDPAAVTRVEPDLLFGHVTMREAARPGHPGGRLLDVDVYLYKEDMEWRVSKVLIHKVDGRPRFGYDEAGRIVSLTPAAPSPAPAPVPKPQAPAKVEARVTLREPSGDGALEGGESGVLAVAVTNAGPGPAYALRLSVTAKAGPEGLLLPPEAALGKLEKGGSLSYEAPVSASEEVPSAKARLLVEVKEGNGFDADPVLVEFKLKAFHPPRLEVADIRLGGSGVVKAGEPTSVAVTVRNSGEGPAKDARAELSIGSPDIFLSGEAAIALGVLEPGRSAAATFEFFVNKRFKGGALPISITLKESRGRYGLGPRSLGLALGEAAPSPQLVSVQGEPAAGGAQEPPDPFADVEAPPASRTPRDPEAYAVVIGVEKYRDVVAVDYAARDAEAVYAYLTRSLGFDAKNVVLLQDGRATKNDLATYLGPWLEDRVTPKSRVFVYYAGHGAPDPKTGEAYLIPYDGNPIYTQTTAVSLHDLYRALARLPAKQVTVALDACFSGAGGRSVIAKGARPLVAVKEGPEVGDRMVVITATRQEQISTFHPERQHGLMTYFLLKGLKGAADADGDGRVTTLELFAYLKPSVERQARLQHVDQSPTIAPEASRLGARGSEVWVRTR